MRIAEDYAAFSHNQLGGVAGNHVKTVKPLPHNRELRVWRADVDIQIEPVRAGRFDNRGAPNQTNFEVIKRIVGQFDLGIAANPQVRARIEEYFDAAVKSSAHPVAGVQIVRDHQLLPVRLASGGDAGLAGNGVDPASLG